MTRPTDPQPSEPAGPASVAGQVSPAVRLALVVLPLLWLVASTPARAGWWDEAGGAKATSLDALRAAPEDFRDVPVTLHVRFERLAADVNPYFTQFTPRAWQPLSVVASDATAGAETASGKPFVRVFVRRGSADDLRLGTLSPGEPLILRAVVRDTAGGDPWLEVLTLTRSGDAATPEETAAIRRAERFLDHGNAPAAAELFREVLAGRRLPDAVDGRVRGRLGMAYYELRRHDEAQPLLAAGLAADPTDRELMRRKLALDEHLAAVASGDRQPLRARDVPETARPTQPAPTAPPRDPALDEIPLRLPGAALGLRGPAGLDGPSRTTPPQPDPPSTTEPPPGATPPPLPPAVSRSPPPAPPARKPAPQPGTEEDDDEPTPPAPPPVPRKPRLSGPR